MELGATLPLDRLNPLAKLTNGTAAVGEKDTGKANGGFAARPFTRPVVGWSDCSAKALRTRVRPSRWPPHENPARGPTRRVCAYVPPVLLVCTSVSATGSKTTNRSCASVGDPYQS